MKLSSPDAGDPSRRRDVGDRRCKATQPSVGPAPLAVIFGGPGFGPGLGVGGGVTPGVWVFKAFYGFAHGSEACGVPGWGACAAVGLVVGFRSRATGLRAQPRGAMPPAALRGRLRGERPRLRGEGRTLHAGGAACGPGPDPSSHRRPEGNQPGLVVSSRITRCWGAASSGWTPPARADWLRPPTRRGIRDLPSVGIGHRSRTTPATMAAAGYRRFSRAPGSLSQTIRQRPVSVPRCPTGA